MQESRSPLMKSPEPKQQSNKMLQSPLKGGTVSPLNMVRQSVFSRKKIGKAKDFEKGEESAVSHDRSVTPIV